MIYLGYDFSGSSTDLKPTNISDQVELLIQEAISVENLSQAYIGWCPFW